MQSSFIKEIVYRIWQAILHFHKLMCFAFVSSSIYAQTVFESHVNLPANYNPPSAIGSSFDGGVLVAGATSIFPNEMYIIKLDSLGNIQWGKNYSSIDIDPGERGIIAQTVDSGYLISLCRYYFNGQISNYENNHWFVIKVDKYGNVVPGFGAKNYDMLFYYDWSHLGSLHSGKQPNEFFVSGRLNDQQGGGLNDITTFYLHLDGVSTVTGVSSYTLVNNNTGIFLLNSKEIYFNNILSGAIISATSIANRKILINLDVAGNTIWSKTYYDSAAVNQFTIKSVVQVDSAFYCLMIGYKIGVLKIDFNGNPVFSVLYDSLYPYGNPGIHKKVNNNGFVISYSRPSNPNNLILMEIDSAGNVINANIDSSSVYSIFTVMDDSTDAVLSLYNNSQNGYFIARKQFPDKGCNQFPLSLNASYFITLDSLINVPLGNYSNDGPWSFSSAPLAISSIVQCLVSSSVEEDNSKNAFIVSPNPSSKQFALRGVNLKTGNEVSVSNLLGKTIYKKEIHNEINSLIVDVSEFEHGLYILHIRSGDQLYSKKIVITK